MKLSKLTGASKRNWTFIIWFQPDDNGTLYELESVKIKTKPMTMIKAQELAVKEAEKYWPHYEIELSIA